MEEDKFYSSSQENACDVKFSEQFCQDLFKNRSIFEIILSGKRIGAIATSIKNFEEAINVLRIDWIFIFPNHLNKNIVAGIVKDLKVFYKNISPDKVEFYLNPNIKKEDEKIFDESGLEICTPINKSYISFSFGNNVQLTPKSQVWTTV